MSWKGNIMGSLYRGIHFIRTARDQTCSISQTCVYHFPFISTLIPFQDLPLFIPAQLVHTHTYPVDFGLHCLVEALIETSKMPMFIPFPRTTEPESAGLRSRHWSLQSFPRGSHIWGPCFILPLLLQISALTSRLPLPTSPLTRNFLWSWEIPSFPSSGPPFRSMAT